MTPIQAKLFGTAARGNRGKALEQAVLASAGRWMRIRKMGAEAKWLGSKEEFDPKAGKMVKRPIITQKKGPVDYIGTIRGGRGIHFDTKQCDLVTRFDVGNEDHFPTHQRRHLIDHGEFGAVAGLLVESTSLKRFYWLDWRSLLTPDKSMPWHDGRLLYLGDSFHAIRFDLIPGIVTAEQHPPAGTV